MMPICEGKRDNLASFRPWYSRILTRAAIGLFLVGLACGEASAQGYVFVMTNEGGVPGRNAIRTFHRDAEGLLTEVSTSPTRTGGTGVHPTVNLTTANLGPFDSDQCMILDASRTRLFAVNGGSDTIAVFNVGSKGQLTAVKGSPFPSQGVNPASVGLVRDSLLVVANKDYDIARPGFNPATRQGNYATFKINAAGSLTYVPGSSIPAGTDGSEGGVFLT